MDYTLVLAFGALTGLAELIARYRDAPFTAATRLPGLLYLALNAVAGAGALGLLKAFGVTFGLDAGGDETRLWWARTLAAGFSAMLLFRSALFIVRVGEKDIPVGPAVVLQAVLGSLDRAIDRNLAADRDRFIAALSPTLPDAANRLRFLAGYCIGLMQNVPADEQKAIRDQIELVIGDKQNTPRDRLRLICLQLLTVVGREVLSKAIEQLRAGGEEVPAAPPVPPPTSLSPPAASRG